MVNESHFFYELGLLPFDEISEEQLASLCAYIKHYPSNRAAQKLFLDISNEKKIKVEGYQEVKVSFDLYKRLKKEPSKKLPKLQTASCTITDQYQLIEAFLQKPVFYKNPSEVLA